MVLIGFFAIASRNTGLDLLALVIAGNIDLYGNCEHSYDDCLSISYRWVLIVDIILVAFGMVVRQTRAV